MVDAATPLSTAVSAPQGLAFGRDGELFAVNGNPSNPQIWSINPTIGNASILADNGIGSGPDFNVLRGITVAPNGTIYVTDVGNNEIFAVNPSTGDRSVVSGDNVGGTTFGGLTYEIALDPSLSSVIPAPSTVVLFALGTAGLIVYRCRRPPRRAAWARRRSPVPRLTLKPQRWESAVVAVARAADSPRG
jgi:hypothetical protein